MISTTRFRVAVPIVGLLLLVSYQAEGQTIQVDVTPSHAQSAVRPVRALGAGIDRLPNDMVERAYAPETMKQVLTAGWGAVTYRSNTELHIEAWHWNPKGSWSDPAGKGYFTGDANPSAEAIRHSYAYPLPHRGVTRNEGTEEVGYGRLTDGDAGTYWKSNPYLTRPFTGEDDATFPQWIVIDMERATPINAMRIAWAAPYARTYSVQYWTGEDAMKQPTKGQWRTFPGGAVTRATGGTALLALSALPVNARFVRVTMTNSSETCDTHGSADRRNCLGYAIAEVGLGIVRSDGSFEDFVHHAPDQSQTATHCSSIDPWHERANLDESRGDQSGLDLFFTSGVTRSLPAMIPVSVVYGTPEDSAAQISYVKRRGYPISYVEMGEEPDGQYMTPEHYAALYLQWATAIHRIDPALVLGGPAFTGQNEDIQAWPDERGNVSWLGRFIGYLKARGRLSDLGFMSFEHYPYDPCNVVWNDLYDEPKLIGHIMDVWRRDGVPKDVPLLVTEVNVTWQTGQTFVDVFGALWLADYVGAFLAAGGSGTYYFHYVPHPLSQECSRTWGTFGMWKTDESGQIKQPTSQFFASQLITKEWMKEGDEVHRVFAAKSDVVDEKGRTAVTAYAVKRPDDEWSLLIVNKDPQRAHTVRVAFHDDDAHHDGSFTGELSRATFGADQYAWHPKGKDGYAAPDGSKPAQRPSPCPGRRSRSCAARSSEIHASRGRTSGEGFPREKMARQALGRRSPCWLHPKLVIGLLSDPPDWRRGGS
jgi:F5/8 type C domain